MSRPQPASRDSTSSAVEMRSICVRPQVGQEMTLTPPRSPQARRMASPARTSSTGSAVRETRMVSPMPSKSIAPMPAADWTVP